MKRTTVAVLALLLLAPAGAAEAKKRPKPCASRGSVTLEENRTARVYEKSDRVVGCHKRTQRRRVLEEVDGVYSGVGDVHLAGRFVAYQYTSVPECKAACPPNVTGTAYVSVVDLRTGESRSSSGNANRLLLAPNGVAAFARGTGSSVELRSLGPGGEALLDSGAIDVRTLTLSGQTLTWVNAGQQKSAQL